MKQRIFIAINLPKEIKEKLNFYQKELEDSFEKVSQGVVRWIKRDNLHLTLIFLGYVSKEEILEVSQITKKIAASFQPFFIFLTKICYAPPQKIPPRMIWVKGEKSPELSTLKNDLEKSLLSSQLNFSLENRDFSPHITLGRIRIWQWRQIEPEERPEIEKEISLNFQVKSLELMESHLKREGAEYTILESFPFKC